MIQYGFFVGTSIAGLVSERRGGQVAAATTAFVVQLVYMFQELGVPPS